MTNIKSMKLYTRVERIENELAEPGFQATDALRVEALSAFEQLHCHGTKALDDFYSAVNYHFQSGKLGRIRICARRLE